VGRKNCDPVGRVSTLAIPDRELSQARAHGLRPAPSIPEATYEIGAGSSLRPIRYSSTARAHERPSAIAQTMSD
jgi:hypothetical protein